MGESAQSLAEMYEKVLVPSMNIIWPSNDGSKENLRYVFRHLYGEVVWQERFTLHSSEFGLGLLGKSQDMR